MTVTGTKAAPADYDTDLTGMAYRRLILTDTSSIDDLVSATSTLDVLVNNAGANFPGGLDEAEPDGFEASVALNLTAPYRLTVGLRRRSPHPLRPAAPAWSFLRPCPRCGRFPWCPATAQPRPASPALTHNLAVKWAPRNIRVNAVVPGVIDTPMTEIAQTVPEIVDAELARIPLRRLGSVTEIASTIAFLCTDQSAYTSGALFVVDGASTSQ